MASNLTPRSTRARRLTYCLLAVLSLLTLPLMAGSVPTAKPEEVGFSSERLQRIHEAIQRHIDAGDITGAVTLVARRGRIAHFEAHGLMDIESKKAMTKDAIFRIMSMTKPVTAVAVMMMLEEGKIRLNDPISKFIPAFKEMKVGEGVPGNREITIQDLLTHTSGMVKNATQSPSDTLATYVPRLAEVPLDFQPGTEWAYSGLAGPDVLARIVEIVSGQPFDQFLRTRIFEPLGMKDTSHYPSDDRRPRVVTLYDRTPQGFQKNTNPDRYSSKTFFAGGAGLISTAEDYLQVAQMLCNGGELNGKRLLSPRTVELMASNHVGDMFNGKLRFPARGFGFGLQVAVMQDHVAAGWRIPNGSFGWFGAYGTQVWINPVEKLVTLVMIQNLNYEVQRDFENAVVQAIVN